MIRAGSAEIRKAFGATGETGSRAALTGKAFEACIQVLDGCRIHIANISHQIRNLSSC